MTVPDLVALLASHRIAGSAPRAELEWVAARANLRAFEAGEVILRRGATDDEVRGVGCFIVLSGVISAFTDRGAGPKRVYDWHAGDVTGFLPYSRVNLSFASGIGMEAGEFINLDRKYFPELVHECPVFTTALVHVMLDRARTFTSADLQDEKMISLGKLSAGLAHELNNPASAAARSARVLEESLAELVDASHARGAANLSSDQLGAVESFRATCALAARRSESPLDRADREDAVTEWLAAHGADGGAAAALVDFGATVPTLAALEKQIGAGALPVAVRWVAADFLARTLVADVQKASSRVHALVESVKRFTYMDRAEAIEPVDIVQGLKDTVSVLRAKASSKNATLTLDTPVGLAAVLAVGGELNQVWSNLIDNALDAVGTGGVVTVSAATISGRVTVTVVDDGPGVPPDLQKRIFDPFFTTKPVGQGTGLGLDIAQRLVRRHNGEIGLSSEQGRTEFRVSFPVHAPRGQ
jgi:signal transduction histidine kinase